MLEMVARSPIERLSAPSPKNSTYAPTTRSLRRNSVSASTMSVAVMPGWRWPLSSTPTMSGRRIMLARPSMTVSASRPPTPTAITPSASTCGVWLSVPTQVSGKATPSRNWMTGLIFSRLIWCMMPLPAGITSTFLNAVFLKRIGVKAGVFHGQRVIDDELGGHHRVHLGRVAALLSNRIAQTGQIDQRCLAQDVVADHAGGVPGKVQIALAVDELLERIGQQRRIAAAHQLLGQDAAGVGQTGVSARLDGIDGSAGVVVLHLGAR